MKVQRTGQEEGFFVRRKRVAFNFILVFLFLIGRDAAADEGRNRFGVEVEGGAFGFSKKDVQVPGDSPLPGSPTSMVWWHLRGGPSTVYMNENFLKTGSS